MASNKPNSRSFRYTDEVKKILEGYIKNGKAKDLADSFDKIVMEAYYTEKERKQRVAELDKTIVSKEAQIRKLIEKFNNTETLLRKIDWIKNNAEQMDKDIKELTKNIIKLKSNTEA